MKNLRRRWFAVTLIAGSTALASACGTSSPVVTPSGKLVSPKSFAASRTELDGLLGKPELDAAGVLDARAATGEELELPRLLSLAASENPELRRLRADILAAEGRENQAGALPNPTIDLSLDRLPTSPKHSSGDVDFSVAVRQPLALTGRLAAGEQAAMRERERREAVAQARARDLESAVQVSFVRYWAAVRTGELWQQITDLQAQKVAIFERDAAQGRRSHIAILDVKDAAARDRLAQLDAAATTARAAANLRAAVGDAQLNLGMPPKNWSLPPIPTGLDRIRTRTWVLGHPKVVEAEKAAAVARANAQLAGRTPDDDAEIRLGYHYEGIGDLHWLTVRLLVPIPVFDRKAGAERAALADEAAALARRDGVIIELLTELEALRTLRETTIERLEIYDDQLLPAARQRLDVMEKQFGARVSTLEIIDAKLDLLRLELEQWALRETAATATYRLANLLGD